MTPAGSRQCALKARGAPWIYLPARQRDTEDVDAENLREALGGGLDISTYVRAAMRARGERE
jgi:hypothetical protein